MKFFVGGGGADTIDEPKKREYQTNKNDFNFGWN